MGTDGDLRKLFKDHIPGDWQAVETWSTGQGVPDANFCIEGAEGWIEMKKTAGWAVNIDANQVGWAERRLRHGGRVFLAVRRMADAGPRRVAADELWLFPGNLTRDVLVSGLKATASPMGVWSGGPKKWEWGAVKNMLTAWKFK
jgi:hypothetical protein